MLDLTAPSLTRDNIVNLPHLPSLEATHVILGVLLRVRWIMPTYLGPINRYFYLGQRTLQTSISADEPRDQCVQEAPADTTIRRSTRDPKGLCLLH